MGAPLTRQEIEHELRQSFEPDQTVTLVNVLDPVYQMEIQRVAETSDLRRGLAALAAAQERTEKRVEELAQAQRHTEKRVEELAQAQRHTEKRVEELAQAQTQTEKRVEELAQAQARTEERLERLEAAVEQLVKVQKDMLVDIGSLKGWRLEQRYRERAHAYFGRVLRRVQVLSLRDFESELESRLSEEEFRDLIELDLLVSGEPRRPSGSPSVFLAVEVSVTIDQHDVLRAQRRARSLARAGHVTVPTVAGEKIGPQADQAAQEANALVLQDGKTLYWEEALAAAEKR